MLRLLILVGCVGLMLGLITPIGETASLVLIVIGGIAVIVGGFWMLQKR